MMALDARPCGSAERSPEAIIVGNDISAAPARRAAYETLRRVFEEGAWADRALRSAAGRLHLEGRERAQAQALAYGAVQRRGTTDHFAAGLANRCPPGSRGG